MWTIRIWRFDNARRAVGAQDIACESKRVANSQLARMGVNTRAKKLLDPQFSLISRVGRVYNIAAK